MRLMIVSSHYPPNFISGGTLAPQRIARGLRSRGHDVSVYAGWLGDREPLDSWTDLDETGMSVRWVVTTPWVDWSSTRNFDNPDVAIDFRHHLREVRPELVHIHSMQSLGVGLIESCQAERIPVVVTMHDFWWVCGRQFLVDRDVHPCSPVVSCGLCHCQVNRDWLDERTARLRTALVEVDRILAVSESSALLLRANGIGVDPHGPPLVVDENGLPPLSVARKERLTGGPVVFLYTGGSEPMKGAGPMLEAAQQLADLDGWELRAHGAAAYVTHFGVDTPPKVTVLPAFLPEEADAVFDGADVLVLPSVMRESHSLVTREALCRGMPVITTDSFGPQEVVKDRDNGLVVPADDAHALAEAMRAVVLDASLRARLAAGALRPVAIRSIDDQIKGLDTMFRETAERRSRTPSAERARRVRRVLFIVGIDGAPLRYRARFPAEALEFLGVDSWIRHYRSPDAVALSLMADVVVVYRVPATRQVLGLIKATRDRGAPVFFDIDDLIFDPEVAETLPAVQAMPGGERDHWLQGVRRYRTTLEACDAFIGTTEMLVDHVTNVVGLRAHRWSNGVGIGPARCSDAALAARSRRAGPLRIGYMSGTTTHDHDWRYVEPAVLEVLRRRPATELWLGGPVTPTSALDAFRSRVKRIDMKPWWELPWVLCDLDVNLAPLAPDSGFNEAKSAIKWLEAALVETATVASSTQPFREVISDGSNGRLADSPDAFESAILQLLDDEPARLRMARQARRDALLLGSPHVQGARYLDILERGELGRLKPSTWRDHVALDEPWRPQAIDDYTIPDAMVVRPLPREEDPLDADDRPAPGIVDRTRDRARRAAPALRRSVDALVRRGPIRRS